MESGEYLPIHNKTTKSLYMIEKIIFANNLSEYKK